MRISLTIAVLALAAPLAAVEQLVVGDGGLSFLDARETSNRLSVLTDSSLTLGSFRTLPINGEFVINGL